MSDITELAYIGLLILLLGRVAKDNFFSDQASKEEVCKFLCLSGPGRGREKSLPLVL